MYFHVYKTKYPVVLVLMLLMSFEIEMNKAINKMLLVFDEVSTLLLSYTAIKS